VDIGSVDAQNFILRFLISCVFIIARRINRNTFFSYFVFCLVLEIEVIDIRVFV
jgi:hypothetical protein